MKQKISEEKRDSAERHDQPHWEQCLERVFAGDDDAMGDLLDEHFRPRLLRFAEKALNNRGSPEDIVQDVFTALMTYHHNIREHSLKSFTSVIFTMTRNACITWLRKQKHVAASSDVSAHQTIEPVTPQHEFEHRELQELLLRAVAEELNEEEQQFLMRRIVHDEPYRVVAEAADLPISTVCDHCHKAFAKLRKRPELRAYWHAMTGKKEQ